jgi:hypothetical protein
MILHIPHAGTDTLGRHIEQFDIDYLRIGSLINYFGMKMPIFLYKQFRVLSVMLSVFSTKEKKFF